MCAKFQPDLSMILQFYFVRKNLHKNSQTVKKGVTHAKKYSMKKFVKSKAASQK